MKRILRNLVVGSALAGVLATGGALSAQALTSQTNFDGNANRYQQSRYFQTQTKSNTSASQIRFSGIGSEYTMNVKAERIGGSQYTEKKGLGEAYTYSIENKTPAGSQTRLIVTNNTWTAVEVTIAGWYKTN